jgi:photosystem II stability/assembly factor-like uncharacterized protein
MKKLILILICILVSISKLFPQNSGWTKVNSGTEINLNAVYSFFGDIVVVGDSGIILNSTDLGETWSKIQSPTNFNLNDVRIQNDNSILAVGDSGLIILSTDQGGTWQFINSGVTDDLLSVDVYDGSGLIGGKQGTVLWCFLEWGNQWELKQTGLSGIELTSVYMHTDGHGYFGGKNSISQALLGESTNSGNNWIFNSFYLNGSEGKISDIDFIYPDAEIGFATSVLSNETGAISLTSDDGITWVTTIFNPPLNAIAIPWTDSLSKGYAVGNSGTILKTYDLGESWNPQQSGTVVKLNDVQIYWWYKDTVFVVGDEGTILRSFSGGEPVNNVAEENELPKKFKLEQNYPNPFNPSTKIKFSIPSVIASGAKQSQLVTLKVFDVLGNEIATLVNEELLPGEYEVEFNDHSGEVRNLTSGVYFYTLKAGGFVQTKKMILMK